MLDHHRPAEQQHNGSTAIHALTSLAADRLQQHLARDGHPGTSGAPSGSVSPTDSPAADPGTSSTGAAAAWPAMRRARSQADKNSGGGGGGKGQSRRMSTPDLEHAEVDEREAKRAKRMQSNRESVRTCEDTVHCSRGAQADCMWACLAQTAALTSQ